MAARFTLHHGDCLKVLKTLPSCSVDAIVTDPPAGIAFMGKEWDTDKGGRDAWIAWMQSIAQECLRVIKPGGHALVWALPRTSHWTGMAWENAGWEPRDKVVHLFGTGFPKSLNVSKAIDKAAGVAPSRITVNESGSLGGLGTAGWNGTPRQLHYDSPTTPEAHQWDGWGTALKPAAEDWWLLRKPIDGTVAGNVLAHGTGALNIDACRIGTEERTYDLTMVSGGFETTGGGRNVKSGEKTVVGRWPANVITDGSEEVVAGFPESKDGVAVNRNRGEREPSTVNYANHNSDDVGYGGSGSAARFFHNTNASSLPDDDVSQTSTDELKPDAHDWWLMRKPLDGTVANNVLTHGTGAINIDGCRIEAEGNGRPARVIDPKETQNNTYAGRMNGSLAGGSMAVGTTTQGRWPANVITDGSNEVVEGFPADRPSTLTGRADPTKSHDPISDAPNRGLIGFASQQSRLYADSGSASRFFYCAKASRRDREEGCEHLVDKTGAEAVDREEGSAGMNSPRAGASRTAGKVKNHHPTVKHTELMRYLCRLITPPSGVVLDAFMGSGSTGKAAMYEGFGFIGIEQDAEYLEIAKARIEYALRNGGFADEVVVKPAPKAGSSLKVLRRKVSDEQIDLFAQSVAQDEEPT